MNVLSLFDGLSGAQIGLKRAGVKFDNYYASEVDKYAIKVTQANFPNTVQLGCIKDLACYDIPEIDLFIGGSPCQGFSFAGKQLNFEDSRSGLFFEYVRLLKSVKPKYFLLENVKMKKDYQDVISKYLGVSPIAINSNLVSAQNRDRLYWFNIPGVKQPEDKNIFIKHILENTPCELFSDIRIENTKIKTKNYIKWDTSGKGHFSQNDRAYFKDGKMCCVPKSQAKSKVNVVESEGVYRRLSAIEVERLQTMPDNYTKHVGDGQRYKMVGNGFTVDIIAHILKNLVGLV